MNKDKRTNKQDNNMSDQYKKRHVDKNGLDLKDRCDSNKERDRV